MIAELAELVSEGPPMITRSRLTFEDRFTQIPNEWLETSDCPGRPVACWLKLMSHTVGMGHHSRIARRRGTGRHRLDPARPSTN